MFTLHHNQVNLMGVINLTPNSFSSREHFFHYHQIKNILNKEDSDFDIWDFGAESTAPFNDAISAKQELERFEKLFFPLIKYLNPKKIISIDTYRANTFVQISQKIREVWPEVKILWNDVSGANDDDAFEVINEMDQQTYYILCHNRIPSGQEVQSHMNFVTEQDIIGDCHSFFEKQLKKITHQRVWLDPNFGFSKSREQNHLLIKNFKKLAIQFKNHHWLIGLSKKSFLRTPSSLDIKTESGNLKVELAHLLAVQRITNQVEGMRLSFRTHHQMIFQSLREFDLI